MQLIQKITMDFAENGIPPKIVGKQDDSGASRAVVIALYNAGVAFEIPSGAAFMLRYKTPSGAYGLYDTMPDGSAAIAAEENRVTVQLVDQIFAVPGRVSCELRIIADGAGVSTWKWYVDVEGSNASDATITSDYINVFSSIAAEVAENADRAEQAAAAIIPESLMHKADYDPTGAVASAGGIAEYVEANAGADMFLTTFSYVNNAWTADQTYAEIYAAHESGKVCVAKYGSHILVLRYVSSSYVLFASAPSDTYVVYTFKITSADAITYAGDTYLRQAALSSSISSTSTTTPASSAAVKAVADVAAEKASASSGTISASQYSGYPAPTVNGSWVRVGDIVQIDLNISTGMSKGDGYTNYLCTLAGFPSQKYGNFVDFLANMGVSVCSGQLNFNDGTLIVKSIEDVEINGTANVRITYIAA